MNPLSLFNSTSLLFLGVLVLVSALLFIYFENKAKEQNHKISSMLSLVSSLTEEVHSIRRHIQSTTQTGGMIKQNNQYYESVVNDDGDDDDEAESVIAHKIQRHKDIFEEFHSNPGASLLNIDKKRRFAMSMATLASKPQKRMTIVREGAIQVLKTLSSNPDEIVQRCCSAAFSFLSSEQAARVRMLDEGAGAAISKLAMSSNQNFVVKHNCCRAMCNLCVEVGCESRLIRDGCLAALMNIINYCPETVDICLVTLFNMSCVSDRFPRIEEMTEVLLRLQGTYPLSLSSYITSPSSKLILTYHFTVRVFEFESGIKQSCSRKHVFDNPVQFISHSW